MNPSMLEFLEAELGLTSEQAEALCLLMQAPELDREGFTTQLQAAENSLLEQKKDPLDVLGIYFQFQRMILKSGLERPRRHELMTQVRLLGEKLDID